MKKIILLLFFALALSADVFAHEAFKLVSSAPKTIKLAELIELEKGRTLGKKDGQNLTFTEKEIRLVVLTGPEDDMLSYRVQGVRNPNLIVPSGATLKILFVNKDIDMRHDVRFGHVTGEFAVAVDPQGTAGSNILKPKAEDETMQAEEFVLAATENGAYKYFCSVRGHAKGGMWGNILVGITPTKDLKTAEKKEHVHSPDEDMEKPATDNKMPADMKMPENKKPDEMKDMKMPDKKSDSMNMPGMTHNHSGMEMSAYRLGYADVARKFGNRLGSRIFARFRQDENVLRRLDADVSRQYVSALHEYQHEARFVGGGQGRQRPVRRAFDVYADVFEAFDEKIANRFSRDGQPRSRHRARVRLPAALSIGRALSRRANP
jgi:plastocyanin